MTNEQNISGRPTDRQLAEFNTYNESLSNPFENIMHETIPEGWSTVDAPRAKDTIYERITSDTYADQLNDRYGKGNWGVMERSEDMVDIIANTLESHEVANENDAEAKELGRVAVDEVVESPGHEG